MPFSARAIRLSRLRGEGTLNTPFRGARGESRVQGSRVYTTISIPRAPRDCKLVVADRLTGEESGAEYRKRTGVHRFAIRPETQGDQGKLFQNMHRQTENFPGKSQRPTSRSCCKSSPVRSDRGKRTQSIAARRMISRLVRKHLNASSFFILRRNKTALPRLTNSLPPQDDPCSGRALAQGKLDGARSFEQDRFMGAPTSARLEAL